MVGLVVQKPSSHRDKIGGGRGPLGAGGQTATSRTPDAGTPLPWCALLAFGVLMSGPGCARKPRQADPHAGAVVVFCAGSLALPLNLIKDRYESRYPDRRIDIEPSGSRLALRKWVGLGRDVDLVALADRHLITEEAMPEHADWCVTFAGNSMVISYTEQAKFGAEISTDNWMEVLARPGVTVGRSDPNTDPCGYRATMLLRLADRHYPAEKGGGRIEERVLANSPPSCVRPKSAELAALLQSKQLDYAFMYRSVSLHHNMPIVRLPAEIDLSGPAKDDIYGQVSVEESGKRPGETVAYVARRIAYGLTVAKASRRRAAAEEFAAFVLGPNGREVFGANGQPFLSELGTDGTVPERLKPVAGVER